MWVSTVCECKGVLMGVWDACTCVLCACTGVCFCLEARWLLDRWAQFSSVLEDLRGFPQHFILRKAASRTNTGPLALHTEHAASSLGVLSLLLHWGVRGRPAEWMQSVLAWLDTLLQRLLGEEAF